jgi:hypothetical protein
MLPVTLCYCNSAVICCLFGSSIVRERQTLAKRNTIVFGSVTVRPCSVTSRRKRVFVYRSQGAQLQLLIERMCFEERTGSCCANQIVKDTHQYA